MVASPDGCSTMSGTPAKRSGDQAPLDGFVEATVDLMNATKEKRGPRRPPKSVSELAERFHALQQLRKLVQDLKQSARKNGQPLVPRRANEKRRPK